MQSSIAASIDSGATCERCSLLSMDPPVVVVIGDSVRPCRGEPVRSPPLNPIQYSACRSPQRRHILGEQYQAQGQHPEAQERQYAEDASEAEQYTCGNPH